MSADMDQVVAKLIEGHSRVEPGAGAIEGWLGHREESLPRRWTVLRPEGGLAPSWAILAAVLILAVGLAVSVAWNRSQARKAQPLLAAEHTVIAPLKNAPPLTAEQKKLIQLLATNPAALATKQPDDLEKPAKKTTSVPHRP